MTQRKEMNLTTYHFQGQLQITNIRGNTVKDDISWHHERKYTMIYPLSIDESLSMEGAEETPVLMNVIHHMEPGWFRQQIMEDELDWNKVRLIGINVISPLWNNSWDLEQEQGKETLNKLNCALEQVNLFRHLNRIKSLRCLGNRFENKVRSGKSSFQAKGVKFLINFFSTIKDYALAQGRNQSIDMDHSTDETMEIIPLEPQTPHKSLIGFDGGESRKKARILHINEIKEIIYKPPVNWLIPQENPGLITIVTDQGEIDLHEVY